MDDRLQYRLDEFRMAGWMTGCMMGWLKGLERGWDLGKVLRLSEWLKVGERLSERLGEREVR